MKKIAFTLFFCAATAFAQAPQWKTFKIPQCPGNQHLVDPDKLLSNILFQVTNMGLNRASISTTLIIYRDVPPVDKEHPQPAEYITDTFAKNCKLGEFTDKGPKPSVVLLVTTNNTSPLVRWSLSVNRPYDAKMQKANNDGYHTFNSTVRKSTPLMRHANAQTVIDAAHKALSENVWPALR